jgi:hypothetical protein
MTIPTVVYIDDNPREARAVQMALDKQLQVHFLLPEEDFDVLMERVFAYRPDAVIVDFRLSDLVRNIRYDGYQVLQSILDGKEKFPVFILTSNQGDAFAEVDDVNFVYEKSQLHNGNATFRERIISQIYKYKKKLEESETRLLALIAKRENENGENLTLAEEKELIELDSFIEKSLDKKSAVPEELKATSNEKKVSDMLKEVDELMEKVKKNLPNS